MNKKLFLLVLAIFAILPNYNVANAQDISDGVIFPQLPHRAKGNTNKTYVYANYNENTGSADVHFTAVLSNVTIKVYYEGVFIDEVTVATTSNGYTETINFNNGEGFYRIVVESNGRTLFNDEFEYLE